MDRRRSGSPIYSGQWSGGSSSTGSSSPVMSPAHPHSRLPSARGFSNIKRTQNVAAKAAAQRLAQVMASQTAEDYEDDDDLGFRFGTPTPPAFLSNASRKGNGVPALSLARPNRSPSPALGRNFTGHTPSVRSTSAGRSSMSVRLKAIVPPNQGSLRTPVFIPPIDPPSTRLRERRFTADIGCIDLRDTGNQPEASALRDELDMLQDENELSWISYTRIFSAASACGFSLQLQLQQLQHEEAEARARELEKQVAALGEGVSLEAKLLSRKEAALRQREATLKAVKQTKDGRNEEIVALSVEIENLKDDTASTVKQLQEVESEAKALHTKSQRMILSHEEMEEVVLKRCWLAHYWGLAVHHGICADVAASKHEHWLSLAPLPYEVVISAGTKAKVESSNSGAVNKDSDRRSKLVCNLNDLAREGNIESMLSVEMALRELASLKVEDAVVLAFSQIRRPNLVQQFSSDPKSSGDSKFTETFELSPEESEEVLFKQAWLMYFWRRANAHGVEEDIAEERLQFWISRNGQILTSHDAVDVERGLTQLRKLGIEQLLWEASRKEIDQLSSAFVATKVGAESETSS